MSERLHITRFYDNKGRWLQVTLPPEATQPVRVWTVEGDNLLEDVTLLPGQVKTLIDSPIIRTFAQLEAPLLDPAGATEVPLTTPTFSPRPDDRN